MDSKPTKPDIAEKRLLELDDVFADVINFVLYGGKDVIKADELISRPGSSKYHAATGEMHENMRDVCKEWKKGDVSFCIFGLENQSAICRIMPVRVMGYDYAAYNEQIRELKKKNQADEIEIPFGEELLSKQKLKPVITIVLYFGMDDWDGPLSLHDMLDIPKGYLKYLSDYKINLIKVAFLEPEDISLFRSDFRILADITRCNRLHTNAGLRYNKEEIRHAKELYDALRALVNKTMFRSVDAWFMEHYQGQGGNGMTTYSIFEEEHEKGKAEGITEGMAKQLLSLVSQNIITKETAAAQFGGTFAELEAAAK